MSDITVLKNGLVFTPDNAFEKLDVEFGEDRITAISPADTISTEGKSVIDCGRCYVIPGLVDVHFHGCAGNDLCGGDVSAIAEYEFAQGVTAICPATMTLPENELNTVLDNIREYKRHEDTHERAELVGIHLEGPFINPEKAGAQHTDHIKRPSGDKIRKWQKASGGLIKLVTIAPEMDGALGCIVGCGDEIHFSLGHTNCSYEAAAKAFNAGADHVTHLYNAMPPFHHRDTGLIGAAIDDGHCFVELICDGIHVSPAAVRAAFKLFGEERIVLISDSMEACGMPDGEYSLGGQAVTVRGCRATLSDGTLAGSVTSLPDCMRMAVSMGIPLENAVRAATINPCRSIGIDKVHGSIEVGKRAHFVLLDKHDLSTVRVI